MTTPVRLRDVTAADLPVFYEQQLDQDATQMAALPAHTDDARRARPMLPLDGFF